MRAISLWQPWASAVALGSKGIETRHWSTKYRGPIAIHAAKRMVRQEMIGFACDWSWCGALGVPMGGRPLWEILPFGAVVAVCELVDCRPSESFNVGELRTPRHREGWQAGLADWTEGMLGNYAPGRFGWVFANVRQLAKPVPFRGAQGFFDVPEALLLEANR